MNSGLEIRGLEEFMDTDISCQNNYVRLKTETFSHRCRAGQTTAYKSNKRKGNEVSRAFMEGADQFTEKKAPIEEMHNLV